MCKFSPLRVPSLVRLHQRRDFRSGRVKLAAQLEDAVQPWDLPPTDD